MSADTLAEGTTFLNWLCNKNGARAEGRFPQLDDINDSDIDELQDAIDDDEDDTDFYFPINEPNPRPMKK